MATFSAADAAFTGFRMVKQHPKTVLAWIGLYMAFTLVMLVVMTATIGPGIAEFRAAAASGAVADSSRSFALLSRLGPLYAISLPVSLAIYSMCFAAVNRLVLRPEEQGFFHIKLGQAEFNQFVIMLVTGLSVLAAYLVGVLLLFVVGAAGAFAVASMAKSAPLIGVIGGIIAFLLAMVAVIAPMAFVGVRISLASAMTFDMGALAFRRAWRLTRGHFWRMFGAYFILWLMLFIALLVFGVIAAALAFGAMMGGAGGFDPARITAMFDPPASVAALFASPMVWVNYLLLSSFYVMGFLLLVGCSAEIYRNLSASSPDKVADTF